MTVNVLRDPAYIAACDAVWAIRDERDRMIARHRAEVAEMNRRFAAALALRSDVLKASTNSTTEL